MNQGKVNGMFIVCEVQYLFLYSNLLYQCLVQYIKRLMPFIPLMNMYFHSITMTNNLTPYNSIKVSNFNYWDRTHYLNVLFASTL